MTQLSKTFNIRPDAEAGAREEKLRKKLETITYGDVVSQKSIAREGERNKPQALITRTRSLTVKAKGQAVEPKLKKLTGSERNEVKEKLKAIFTSLLENHKLQKHIASLTLDNLMKHIKASYERGGTTNVVHDSAHHIFREEKVLSRAFQQSAKSFGLLMSSDNGKINAGGTRLKSVLALVKTEELREILMPVIKQSEERRRR